MSQRTFRRKKFGKEKEKKLSDFSECEENLESEKCKENEIKFEGNFFCGEDRENSLIRRDWGKEENLRFLKGCLLFGNNWNKVN